MILILLDLVSADWPETVQMSSRIAITPYGLGVEQTRENRLKQGIQAKTRLVKPLLYFLHPRISAVRLYFGICGGPGGI
jgi:hypothetical protein